MLWNHYKLIDWPGGLSMREIAPITTVIRLRKQIEVAALFDFHGVTMNFLLLFSVPLGVLTETKPVVAPLGTVAVR